MFGSWGDRLGYWDLPPSTERVLHLAYDDIGVLIGFRHIVVSHEGSVMDLGANDVVCVPTGVHLVRSARHHRLDQRSPTTARANVEQRIDFFRGHFYRVAHQLTLTSRDNPWIWATRIASAQNAHMRSACRRTCSGAIPACR